MFYTCFIDSISFCVVLLAFWPFLCVSDTDECQYDDSCDQGCENTDGSFVCSCNDGYRLSEDRVNCIAINGTVTLF